MTAPELFYSREGEPHERYPIDVVADVLFDDIELTPWDVPDFVRADDYSQHALARVQAEAAFGDAMECWHECYAEEGASFVLAGGSRQDANLVASLGASQRTGGKPRRADFGLPPEQPPARRALPRDTFTREDIRF